MARLSLSSLLSTSCSCCCPSSSTSPLLSLARAHGCCGSLLW
uniref:Uncharacterized protein n=1 Tax=Arundo donax TaxID=35708 RepID=A0A0A9HMV2_ARUDO